MELAKTYSQINISTTGAGGVKSLVTAASGQQAVAHALNGSTTAGTVRIETTTASSVLGTTGNTALNGAQASPVRMAFAMQREGGLQGVTGQHMVIGSTGAAVNGWAIVSNQST